MNILFGNKSAVCVVIAWIATTSAICAQPQSHQAQRYINAQGIEIVQNRAARVAPERPESPVNAAGVTGSLQLKSKNRIEADPVELSGTRVAPQEQKARDQDRLAILRKELSEELGRLETAIAALQTRQIVDKTDSEDMQRLKQAQGRHEQNIKSLVAEIKRAQMTR